MTTTVFGIRVSVSFPMIIGLIVATFVLNFVNTLVRERTTSSWDAARRQDLVRAFRRADFPVQSSYSGAGLTAATEQISRASRSIGAIVGLINTAVRTLVYVGIALAISWQISLLVIGAGGVLMLGLRQISKRTRVDAQGHGQALHLRRRGDRRDGCLGTGAAQPQPVG